MLDAQELGKRLTAAMDYRDPPLKSVELAQLCGVTKQAVHEWRTTGRIGKAHLITIAQATGTPLEYWLEPARGASKSTRFIWMKFGKAFARAAMLAFLALGFLLPSPADMAPSGDAKVSVCVLCKIIRRLFLLVRRYSVKRNSLVGAA